MTTDERKTEPAKPKRRIWRSAARVLGVVAAFVALAGMLLAQPSCRTNRPSTESVDPARLRAHVAMLCGNLAPRDWQSTSNLAGCAQYIADELRAAGAEVERQEFTAAGLSFENVIGRFGPATGAVLVVGAHYDAHRDTPGADDNASGVAVLLELARLLGRRAPTGPVELVAYTLEEPPFFGTDQMGSAIHAKRAAESGTGIRGVIVLEMVGCFSDRPGSQGYPLPLLKLIYPRRGNFIGVVGRSDQGEWIAAIKVGMKGATPLPVYSIRAPAALPGLDFSDHRNYWPHGIPAVMMTDTAFYRNRNYHQPTDTPETLDYERMAEVVIALHAAILAL